jgi:Family of unknown function (DUF6624)
MNLQKELLKRFKIDQEYTWTNENKARKIYQENSLWLKEIINKNSWPSKEFVGINGEESAWLITQHSPDINFQEKCLKLIKKLPLTNERKEYMEYLTDRILINKGEPQKYGTQFTK